MISAGVHARCGAAAETDQQSRPAELNEQRACVEGAFLGVRGVDLADAAGDHDGFVIAAHLARDGLFIGAEIARQVGSTKLVVKRRATDGAVEHDLQRRRDAIRATIGIRFFPRLNRAGNLQIGNRETRETRLGLGSAARCSFVAYFAAAARRRAGVGRNRGRVIVGFHFHQRVS